MSKPPAKRRAKRKAADADIDADDELAGNSLLASLDLSKSKTGPKAIAAALLTLLPENATRQHAMAQKLTKAFPLVISELETRSNILARESESQGTRQPIAFRFPASSDEGKQGEKSGSEEEEAWSTIHLPEDSFLNIMKFLTGRQIVLYASLVSKSWLAASRNPLLWETLDNSCGLTNANKKLNMTALQNLLRRPQFGRLKHLTMPHNALKLSAKSIKQLSQLCPHLESFSVGYATNITGPKMKGADLIGVVETFSKLNAIHTHMWSITHTDILSVAKIMECKCIANSRAWRANCSSIFSDFYDYLYSLSSVLCVQD